MISKEQAAEILRLHLVEHWPVESIAKHLHLHHSVIRRVLLQRGHAQASVVRMSKLDAYIPFMKEMLEQHPKLHASRLFRMCEERGYQGSESHFRRIVRRIRPRPKAEAYLRLRSFPGEQGQVDWGHFGKIKIGRASRPLMAFVLVLSYSRAIFLRFYLSQKTEVFMQGHVEAFERFQGVPRVLLYDNLKSCVLERKGDAIRFHPMMYELSSQYLFEAKPVAVARGNEKGRVERIIRFVRTSFFAARPFKDLADLNRQADAWCIGHAMERPWPEDRSKSVREAFEEEQGKLLPLPDAPFPCLERVEVKVGKTPYVRFDGNDYSLPHEYVRCTLCVHASLSRVRILDGAELLAEHERCYSKAEQIEDPAHIEALVQEKRRARKHRGFDRLFQSAPSSRDFMQALAERGMNLGNSTARLLVLLDEYGAKALDTAIVLVLEKDIAQVESVALLLEKERKAQGILPQPPVQVPDDPRLRDLHVESHDLASYDQIGEEQEKEKSDDEHDTDKQ